MVQFIVTTYRPKFAWFPTKMDCGSIVWLQTYQSINGGKSKRLFEKR